MNKITFILLASFLTGCTTWRGNNRVDLDNINPEIVSQINDERRIAQTGDYFLASWPYALKERIEIKTQATVEGINQYRFAGFIKIKQQDFKATLFPGLATLYAQDDKGNKYYSSLRGIEYKYAGDDLETIQGGLMIPSDTTKPPNIYWHPPEKISITVSAPPNNGKILFVNADNIGHYLEHTGFGQTITYIGLSNKQIRFVYKEFQDDLIRNAFTQEFGFDYVPGQVYGYKNTRFIVHKATPTDIEYTVLNSTFGQANQTGN